MATLNFPDDPSTVSNIREIDDISSGFDGSDTTFTLQVAGVNVEPANAQQLIISVGGVMQNAGQDFTVSGAVLTFTTAPSSGLTFFGVLLGTALSLNTVADASVGSASLKVEDFTIGGSSNTVTIPGNLTVQGTETIINVDELNIQDKTIGIASTNAPTATTQDGAGAIIYGETHIDILYDVDKAALGISTAVNVSGFVTATRAQIGSGVTITNTGIDIGIGGVGVVTTGNVTGASATITSAVVGTGVTINNTGIDLGIGGVGVVTTKNITGAAATISSSLMLGTAVKTATQGTEFVFQQAGTDFATSGFAPIRYSNDTSGPTFGFAHSRNASLNGQTILQDGDEFGKIRFYGSDGVDFDNYGAQIRARVDGTPGADDMPGRLEFATTPDGSTASTERLRITRDGGFQFSNGLFDEKCNIVAGQLSDNDNIDLENGMVHYFSVAEDTTASPNIRINASTTLQSAMDTGDVCTVTIIINAAAAGYYDNVRIDATNVTEEWVGGSAPAAGSADGLDIYTYTIICIGTGTGDSGFKVIANMTNATN